MRADWNVTTPSQAVQFLSRAFRHQYQRETRGPEINRVLQIILDAQNACLDLVFKGAA